MPPEPRNQTYLDTPLVVRPDRFERIDRNSLDTSYVDI